MEQTSKIETAEEKVLAGNGIIVETVQIQRGEADERLLRLKNTKSPYASEVKLHRRVDNDKSFLEWQAQRDGTTFRLIIERRHSTSNRYELWLPGRRMGITLTEDEGLSRELDGEELVDIWRRQR